MKRRDVLHAAPAFLVAGTGLAHANTQADKAASLSLNAPVLGPRMNLDQARKVMDQLDLDALVLGAGINVYHAIGYWPLTSRMGHAPSTFAVVTKREDQPLSVVLSSFTYYYQLADVHDPAVYPAYVYTAPTGEIDDNGEPIAAPIMTFRDRAEVPMDEVESRRASLAQVAMDDVGASPAAKHALARALKDLGVASGTIAVDHATAAAVLEDASPQAKIVDADLALRRIRPVKSDLEIALMRQAAQANTDAALAAVRAVRAGATYRELRATFFSEAAKYGNRGVFMVIDRVSSEVFDAPFQDGQAFLIDAVSENNGYHGDYGRTIFIGEPAKAMKQATDALSTAWQEVRHALKPGMRFSEISAMGRDVLKTLGVDYTVTFSPHSVGLYHTDHVGMAGAAAFREDPVLEPGMIISVDCPMLEAGIGGSAHLEDLMLITASGSEPINATGDDVIVV